MGLLDVVKKRKADEKEGRARLWKEYRKILERREKPKPGDPDRIAELLDVLGLEPEEVDLHCWVLEEAGRCQAEHDGAPALYERIVDLTTRFNAARVAYCDAKRLLEALEPEHHAMAGAYGVALSRGDDLRTLQRQFPSLLGGDDATPPERLTNPRVPTALSEKLRELGLTAKYFGATAP